MADDLDGRASIEGEITGCDVYMPIKDRTIPRVARGARMRQAERITDTREEKTHRETGAW